MSSTLITGVGVTAPNGLGAKEYWEAALAGRTGIAELTRFDTTGYPSRLIGEVSAFVPEDHLSSRVLLQTDRSTQLALIAADWALSDAGVVPKQLPDYGMGVVTSSALGGFGFTHKEFWELWNHGPEFVSVYESFAWFYAVNTGQVSIRHGMRGPSAALVGEQAGGLDALGHARRTVRRGTGLVISGGCDSALDPWGYVSQFAGGLVSTETDPALAYRPFDVDASGYVPGEGGAFLILEDADAAVERGVGQVYGELAGYAATFDPAPGSDAVPGQALGKAAELALADAGVRPDQVDVVYADASGVPELDRAEAAAITGLFGAEGVPVTAPKSLTGRLYSGGGPLDVATALLSIRDGLVPPTGGTTRVAEEYGLDLVLDRARELPVRTALVLARGRRGFNSAVVVRAVGDAAN